MDRPHNFATNHFLVSRRELFGAVALGCGALVLFALLVYFTPLGILPSALISVFLYLSFVALIGSMRKPTAALPARMDVHAVLEEQSAEVLKHSAYPVLIFDVHGIVHWHNPAAEGVFSSEELCPGCSVSSLCGTVPSPEEDEARCLVSIGEKAYAAECFPLGESELYVLFLSDVTQLSAMEKKYQDERVAVAYIAIDNVEDILQYVHEKFRDAVSAVDDRLKSWAAELHGVIKSYENDKYIMFFDSARLDACIADRFEILDSVRDTRLGDGVSITVSIGVSCYGDTLQKREQMAREAIDLALQRGGDQAVYRHEGGTDFYGGRTKSVYKRSNVRSRTFTGQLMAMMARADNVLIMGHRYGDFDSFGASVGVYRLAMLCGIKCHIAVDLHDKNLVPCIQMLQGQPEYADAFVDHAEGLDLLTPDTLLVVVDLNTSQRAQFADIAAKVGTIAMIDHHRKIDKIEERVKLSYIEPSASSTCELVTEMLQNTMTSQDLHKEEADILLSGILLDTKQFTRNTGTRTFGAAQYLRGAGASPTDVYELFKTDAKDLSKEARFHTSIVLYREHIAISACDGDTDESYRVIASKAADKMLTLRSVEAAFTLVRIGEQIHISGRSAGRINVQLILEKLHGGGHFDVAGAQVTADSVMSVLDTLKGAIDEYLELYPM